MTIDASGLIHWIPDDANVGDTVIVVRVYDDSSSADTSVFSITVTGVNDAPVFSGIPDITISEDFSDSSILPADYVSDDDNNVSEISFSVSGYDTLSVSIQAGRIYIIPPENWSGVDSFVVSGSDPAGGSGYDTVTVTVRPINDAPVIASISDKVVTEDGIFTCQIEVTDVDGDSFRYELLTAPDGMVVSSSGLITWNPGNDDVGDAAVAAAVYDDSSAADTVMFSITVVDENDAPVLAGIPDLVIVEDMPDSSIDLSDYVTDVDNTIDEITFSVTGDDYLSITIAGGKVHIVPQENWSGQDTIIFGAQDPAGEFSYDTLVVSVIPANDAPRIVSIPDTSVYEDSEYVYQVEASDADGDSLRIELLTAPGGMTIDASGLIHWIPDNEDVGDTVVAAAVFDDSAASDTQTFTLTVINVNDAPVISGVPDVSFYEDNADTIRNLYQYVTDVDNADEDISFSYSGYKHLSIETNLTDVIITPYANWYGEDTVVITASDIEGGSSSDTIYVTALPVNDPPSITGLSDLVLFEGCSHKINLNEHSYDCDDDKGNLQWGIYGGTHISFSLTDTLAVFLSETGWYGTETFIFILYDAAGLYDRDTIDIESRDVNDPPVIGEKVKVYTFYEDSSLLVNYSGWAADADGDDIIWEFTGSENITVQVDTGAQEIMFLPAADYFGSDTLIMKASDGLGGLDSGIVVCNVTNINDAPVILSISPDEDTAYVKKQQSALFSFTSYDADGDSLTVSWNLDGITVSADNIYNYTAGDEMEVRALNLVVSDGAESAERNWIIMSAWDVGVMLEHFSLRGNQNEGVQIVWGILDDDGIIGFNILRSTDKKGQYEKINPVLIQNIDENRFTFSDTYLEPGRDYYYKLECVSSGGGSFV
ncbi:tandem-95 repeat protein, partial [bacterium]|nr:tandem-95 repeat protein [bacterium]